MRQRQLGAGKQRIGDQADLTRWPTAMVKPGASPQPLAMTVGAAAAAPARAARADKPFGPTRPPLPCRTDRGSQPATGRDGMEWNAIHGHERDLDGRGHSVRQRHHRSRDAGSTSALISSVVGLHICRADMYLTEFGIHGRTISRAFAVSRNSVSIFANQRQRTWKYLRLVSVSRLLLSHQIVGLPPPCRRPAWMYGGCSCS